MRRKGEKQIAACGRSGLWKSRSVGKSKGTDFSTSLGNSQNLRIPTFPQPRRRQMVLYRGNRRTANPNPTSSEINLLQQKNGLDFGVHHIDQFSDTAIPARRCTLVGNMCTTARNTTTKSFRKTQVLCRLGQKWYKHSMARRKPLLETPIERIFREVFGRTMTPIEKGVILRKASKKPR
jgi:hypothetical protein